jgi:hypothetical protein
VTERGNMSFKHIESRDWSGCSKLPMKNSYFSLPIKTTLILGQIDAILDIDSGRRVSTTLMSINEAKLIEKLDYMHNNPVKAALVLSPSDYDWSSCREYV